jgi:hypothetical protein
MSLQDWTGEKGFSLKRDFSCCFRSQGASEERTDAFLAPNLVKVPSHVEEKCTAPMCGGKHVQKCSLM